MIISIIRICATGVLLIGTQVYTKVTLTEVKLQILLITILHSFVSFSRLFESFFFYCFPKREDSVSRMWPVQNMGTLYVSHQELWLVQTSPHMKNVTVTYMKQRTIVWGFSLLQLCCLHLSEFSFIAAEPSLKNVLSLCNRKIWLFSREMAKHS